MCYKRASKDKITAGSRCSQSALTFIFSFSLTLVYGCSPLRLIPVHCVDVYLLLKGLFNLFCHYKLHPRASCFIRLKGFCPCIIFPTDFSQHTALSSTVCCEKKRKNQAGICIGGVAYSAVLSRSNEYDTFISFPLPQDEFVV